MSISKIQSSYICVIPDNHKTGKEFRLEFNIDFRSTEVHIVSFNGYDSEVILTPVEMEYLSKAMYDASQFATKEIEDYVNSQNKEG